MKTPRILAALALSLLAAGAAQAETYDGVHQVHSLRGRADLNAEAVLAARAGNPYADGAPAAYTAPFVSMLARSAVRAEAVAAAHEPNPYSEGYGASAAPIVVGLRDRATVQAEARAAARDPRQIAF